MNATTLLEESTTIVVDQESEDEEGAVETAILEVEQDTYLMDVDSIEEGIVPESEETEPTTEVETSVKVTHHSCLPNEYNTYCASKEHDSEHSQETLAQTVEVIHEELDDLPALLYPPESLDAPSEHPQEGPTVHSSNEHDDLISPTPSEHPNSLTTTTTTTTTIEHTESLVIPTQSETSVRPTLHEEGSLEPEPSATILDKEPQIVVDLNSNEGRAPSPQLSILTTGPYVPYFQRNSPAQTTVSDFSSSTNPFAMNYVPPSERTTHPDHRQHSDLPVFSNAKSLHLQSGGNPYVPLYLASAPPVPSQPTHNTPQVNLANDPYPLNLSTPGLEAGEETDDSSQEDGFEQATSLSSATDSAQAVGLAKVKPTTSAIDTNLDAFNGTLVTPMTPTSVSPPNGAHQTDDTPKSSSKRESNGSEKKSTNGDLSSYVSSELSLDINH